MQATWEKGKYGLMFVGLTMWRNWRSFYCVPWSLWCDQSVDDWERGSNIDMSANHASTNTDTWATFSTEAKQYDTLNTFFLQVCMCPSSWCLVSFPRFVGGLGMRLLFAWLHMYLYILNKLADGREDLIRDCITDGSHTLWYAPVGLLGEVHGESCDVMWF